MILVVLLFQKFGNIPIRFLLEFEQDKERTSWSHTPLQKASHNGYSLKGLPKNAMPTGGHKGLHSYTIMKGQAKIEVLLRQKAFYVRGPPSIRGQVTWSKFPSIRDAWIAACTKAGVLP